MKKISGFIIIGLILVSVIVKFIVLCNKIDNIDDNLTIILALVVLVSEVCAIPAILFYVDRNKNDSLIPIAGYISIVVFIGIVTAYIITLKNSETQSMAELNALYEKVNNFKNYQNLVKNIIVLFEYVTIVNLLHFKTLNSKAQLSKVFAFLAAFIFFVLSTILIWKTEDNEKLQYAAEMTKDIYYLFLALFVTFQSIGDGVLSVPVTETQQSNSEQSQEQISNPVNQEPIFGNSASGKPKFRNPALEEQEARLAAQKAAQNQTSNQQIMPTMGIQQPSMSTTPNIMPQQPMTQQPMAQPQPMNQPPIDPAMGVPPITNQQYPQ